MGTDVLVGTIHIGLADEEGLAEVEVVLHLGVLLDDFTLQESQGGVGPAGAAAVLVLDAGDGMLNDGGEDEGVLRVFLLVLLGHFIVKALSR